MSDDILNKALRAAQPTMRAPRAGETKRIPVPEKEIKTDIGREAGMVIGGRAAPKASTTAAKQASALDAVLDVFAKERRDELLSGGDPEATARLKEKREWEEGRLPRRLQEANANPLAGDIPLPKQVVAPRSAKSDTATKRQTETQTPLTQGIRDSFARQEALVNREEALLREQQGAVDASALSVASLEAQRSQIARQFEEDRQNLENTFRQEMDRRLGDIETLTTEYAKMKPQDFWADKTTPDKLRIGLALIIGGAASAFRGLKTNSVQDHINSIIDQNMRTYELAANKKLKQIEQSKVTLKDRQALQNSVRDNLASRRMAALSKVEDSIRALQMQTKNEQAKAALEQQIIELQGRREQERVKLEQDLAGTVVSENIIKASGGLGKASDTESKTIGYINLAAPAAENLENLEQSMNGSELEAYKHANADFLLSLKSSGFLSKAADMISNGMEVALDTELVNSWVERAAVAGPKAIEAISQMQVYMDAILRDRSGAVIKEDELFGQIRQAIPVKGDTTKSAKDKMVNRRQAISAMRSKLPAEERVNLWYEQGKNE